VLQHLADLWSYDVVLREIDPSDVIVNEYVTKPRAMNQAA
jgi:stage V sporulation protein R